MRVIKILLWILLPVLAATVLAIALSSVAEPERGETILSFFGMRLTVTGAGAGLSFLTFLGFAGIRFARNPNRKRKSFSFRTLADAAGFGFLPGTAVWKVYEQFTPLAAGTPVFEPLPVIGWIMQDGCFAPARMEMILSLLCFAGIIIWLILRKDDFSRNGDLPGVVLCLWGLVRALTESIRAVPFLHAGSINLTQILFLLAADVPLIFWTGRGWTKKKSTVFTALEWIAVLSCETVLVLNTSGVLTVGSDIGDFAVNCGCTILSILVILLAGKDSRS